jgi:hypothetical protein
VGWTIVENKLIGPFYERWCTVFAVPTETGTATSSVQRLVHRICAIRCKLCEFHVLKAVNEHLCADLKANAEGIEQRVSLLHMFKGVLRAKTEAGFKRLARAFEKRLADEGRFKLVNYFSEQWFCGRWVGLWEAFTRASCPYYLINTTNGAESLFSWINPSSIEKNALSY